MRNFLLLLIMILMLASCIGKKDVYKTENITTKDKDTFFQYNIWWGFVNKIFQGNLTVKEMKERGDIGLGSYDLLDGELVMLDGISYRFRDDGSVAVADDDDKVIYVNAGFFEPEMTFEITEQINYDRLREIINLKLPTLNQFYSFKISGEFDYMKCGGLDKQEKPFRDGLDVLIPNRPIFEQSDFTGTIVGFYCPEFIGNINVAGYHIHAVSEEKDFGGHVMEFQSKSLKVEIDPMLNYHFQLVDSEDFMNVQLDKEFQYKKK